MNNRLGVILAGLLLLFLGQVLAANYNSGATIVGTALPTATNWSILTSTSVDGGVIVLENRNVSLLANNWTCTGTAILINMTSNAGNHSGFRSTASSTVHMTDCDVRSGNFSTQIKLLLEEDSLKFTAIRTNFSNLRQQALRLNGGTMPSFLKWNYVRITDSEDEFLNFNGFSNITINNSVFSNSTRRVIGQFGGANITVENTKFLNSLTNTDAWSISGGGYYGMNIINVTIDGFDDGLSLSPSSEEKDLFGTINGLNCSNVDRCLDLQAGFTNWSISGIRAHVNSSGKVINLVRKHKDNGWLNITDVIGWGGEQNIFLFQGSNTYVRNVTCQYNTGTAGGCFQLDQYNETTVIDITCRGANRTCVMVAEGNFNNLKNVNCHPDLVNNDLSSGFSSQCIEDSGSRNNYTGINGSSLDYGVNIFPSTTIPALPCENITVTNATLITWGNSYFEPAVFHSGKSTANTYNTGCKFIKFVDANCTGASSDSGNDGSCFHFEHLENGTVHNPTLANAQRGFWAEHQTNETRIYNGTINENVSVHVRLENASSLIFVGLRNLSETNITVVDDSANTESAAYIAQWGNVLVQWSNGTLIESAPVDIHINGVDDQPFRTENHTTVATGYGMYTELPTFKVNNSGQYNYSVSANTTYNDKSANASFSGVSLGTITLTLSSGNDSIPAPLSTAINNSAPQYTKHVNMNATWFDSDNLSCFKFFSNLTGINDSCVVFDSRNLSSRNLTVNLTRGQDISWKFYANDSFNQWNETILQTFTVNNTQPDPANISFPNNSVLNYRPYHINFSSFDSDGDKLWFYVYLNGSLEAVLDNNITLNNANASYYIEVLASDNYTNASANSSRIYYNVTVFENATVATPSPRPITYFNFPIVYYQQNISLSIIWSDDSLDVYCFTSNITGNQTCIPFSSSQTSYFDDFPGAPNASYINNSFNGNMSFINSAGSLYLQSSRHAVAGFVINHSFNDNDTFTFLPDQMSTTVYNIYDLYILNDSNCPLVSTTVGGVCINKSKIRYRFADNVTSTESIIFSIKYDGRFWIKLNKTGYTDWGIMTTESYNWSGLNDSRFIAFYVQGEEPPGFNSVGLGLQFISFNNSLSNRSSHTLFINHTYGTNISWKFYANDTQGNRNESIEQYIYVADPFNTTDNGNRTIVLANNSIRINITSFYNIDHINVSSEQGYFNYTSAIYETPYILERTTLTDNLTTGSHTLNYTFCDTAAQCKRIETLFYKHNNSVSYTPAILETDQVNIYLFINFSDVPIINVSGFRASLVFNGTSYNGTFNNVTGLFNFTTIPIPPEVPISQAVTFFFNYSLNGFNFNSSFFTQTINDVTFSNCSSIDNATLIFNVFNEDVPLNNLVVDFEIWLAYWTTTPEVANNFSIRQTGNYTYPFCLDIGNGTVYSNIYVLYTSSPGHTNRYYRYNQSLFNATTNFTIFNLNVTTDISTFKGTVRDRADYDIFPNIVTTMQRFYVGENVWRTVQMSQSDQFGLVQFNIREKTTDYRFLLHDQQNNLLETTPKNKFVCDATICDVTFMIDPFDGSATPSNLSVGYIFDNSTGILNITWNDPTLLTSTVRIYVSRESLGQPTVICHTNQTGSAGEFSCNVSGQQGTLRLTVFGTASPEVPIFSDFIDYVGQSLSQLIAGEELAFWGFGLFTTLTFLGVAISPVVAIVGGLFGFIIISSFGLLNFVTVSFLAAITVLALLIALRLRQ